MFTFTINSLSTVILSRSMCKVQFFIISSSCTFIKWYNPISYPLIYWSTVISCMLKNRKKWCLLLFITDIWVAQTLSSNMQSMIAPIMNLSNINSSVLNFLCLFLSRVPVTVISMVFWYSWAIQDVFHLENWKRHPRASMCLKRLCIDFCNVVISVVLSFQNNDYY